MSLDRYAVRQLAALAVLLGLLSACGLRRKKYENPISKDTQQPDKVLFDKAIGDIEHSRYEVARLTLQTLINTYDSSEYLAKAKLAIADSWYREGGAHGLAQAEAEYKDFILFYPTMEESAEAQEKVCMIHYKQMEKADRDPLHANRAEDECRQLLVQFPNSKFAPQAQQLLRNIQEVLAEHEFRTAYFYHHKGSYPAAANRFEGLIAHYPLYSGADEALYLLADSYKRMGDRFEDRQAAALAKIVKDYPLSEHVDEAKERLVAMNKPVPEADPVALARMKYELENRQDASLMSHFWGAFRRGPDMHLAAKSGTPAMDVMKIPVPLSVPAGAQTAGAATGGTGVSADVSVSTVSDSKALDTQPDARANPPAQTPAGTTPAGGAAPASGSAPAGGSAPAQGSSAQPAAASQPLPTNHMPKPQKKKKEKKAKKSASEQTEQQQQSTPQPQQK